MNTKKSSLKALVILSFFMANTLFSAERETLLKRNKPSLFSHIKKCAALFSCCRPKSKRSYLQQEANFSFENPIFTDKRKIRITHFESVSEGYSSDGSSEININSPSPNITGYRLVNPRNESWGWDE